MQPNTNSDNRSTLASVSHSKSYDPSAPYRAMMMPHPPVPTVVPTNNPYYSNPTLSQGSPANTGKKTGGITRIPQYYYPRYHDLDGPPFTQPNFVEPRETDPNLQPVPHEAIPYHQPVPLSIDPYASAPYYPYSTPYIIPWTTHFPQVDPAASLQERSKSDVIASHQKDADLSRLEVYHFTPKQNTSLSTGTVGAPPIVQYHVYPPPALPQQQQQQQLPSYSNPWYANPPNPSHIPEQSQPVIPSVETKARSSQTEEPSTKSRGVSPIHFSTAAPILDDDGYPYVHHKTKNTDRYNVPTGRINRRSYDNNSSTPLPDCRCLDCQRERGKVLNYYPD